MSGISTGGGGGGGGTIGSSPEIITVTVGKLETNATAHTQYVLLTVQGKASSLWSGQLQVDGKQVIPYKIESTATNERTYNAAFFVKPGGTWELKQGTGALETVWASILTTPF